MIVRVICSRMIVYNSSTMLGIKLQPKLYSLGIKWCILCLMM